MRQANVAERRQLDSPVSDDASCGGRPRWRANIASWRQQQLQQRQTQQGQLQVDDLDGVGTHRVLAQLSGQLKGGEAPPSKLARLCRALERRAYEMRPEDAVRALELLRECAAQVGSAAPEPSQQAPPEVAATSLSSERTLTCIREGAHCLAASVAARLLKMNAAFVADALEAFSSSPTTCRQEWLDSALARLLLLVHTEPRTVTPPLMGRIVGAIGCMQAGGLAQRGAPCPQPYAGSSERSLAAFNALLVRKLPDFLEDDLGAFHEAYCDVFSEQQMGRIIDRAAHLQVGLRPESQQHLAAWQRIVGAVRVRFPRLLPALSEFAHRYCRELAATASHRAGGS